MLNWWGCAVEGLRLDNARCTRFSFGVRYDLSIVISPYDIISTGNDFCIDKKGKFSVSISKGLNI